ncbi:MAG: oligosaccharide flippase family protein [Bacteroidaceae bacterium]|nr:oligosaccharide flippase family protein [Bacteroidaceae bacterium]
MSVIDQKRIAKNTLLLYIRMGLIMLISLYTSRVVLDALGETDQGIYATVAGIVMMFAFLSNTMSTACQRFYAYEMGRGDFEELKRVFSICVTVFIGIALIVVIFCETLGLYFLYDKIKTDGRMNAALWVFQCAILSFVFTILRSPFQGMIIIKEKMKVFTYISVVEALGNLAIALLIAHSSNDRLILYGILMLVLNALVSLYYIVYCVHFYGECRYRFCWDKGKFGEIFSFAGWNMIGSLASVCKSQGLTILLNIFFGNAVVAARAMAYKVYSTIQQFADSFFNAIRPQIMKSYSSGEREGMFKLVYQSSKFSYFLLFAVSLPLLLETPLILDIWLKDVPEGTIIFTRLVIINALIDVLTSPLATAMNAQGEVKWYYIICGGILLLILPISALFLKLGYPPSSVFWVSIVVSLFAVGVRVLLLKHYLKLSVSQYLTKVIVPICIVTISSSVIPLAGEWLIPTVTIRFFAVCLLAVVSVMASVYLWGLTASERKHALEFLRRKVHDRNKG